MDPFSILTGAAGLAGLVVHICKKITKFVNEVHEAKDDMKPVQDELKVFGLALQSLNGPLTPAVTVPPNLELDEMLRLYGKALRKLERQVDKYRNKNKELRGRIAYVWTGKKDMEVCRQNIKTYSLALTTAATLINVLVLFF
jgi:hypothetical protein